MNGKHFDPADNHFNPANKNPEQLLAEFIDRKHLLARILDIVRHNTPDRPQQHVMLIGPRGMGKTTLLCAINYSVLNDAELNAGWLPVLFSEEQYNIGDLADFWLESARHLEAAMNRRPEAADRLLHENPDDLADQAQELFFQLLVGSGKRALLLVDNINDIFRDINDGDALNKLRALWMTDPRIMLVGAAPSYFEHITAVDQAFHDFFRAFSLDRLNQDELEAFLRRLAELHNDDRVIQAIEQTPERVAALRILTGGNPRLIIYGYRMLRDGVDGDARQDLERLLNECTPFFKHRIEGLAKEARRTFDAIARRWDPVSVDDIRAELRKPSNYISAQIRRLIDDDFIEEAGGGKKKSYQVSERFYNVFYLMRYSRDGRRRLRWLIGFMQTFYSKRDFKDWAKRLEAELKTPLSDSLRTEKLAHLHALSAAADSDSRSAAFEAIVRDAIKRNDRSELDEDCAGGDPVESHGYRYLAAELCWLLKPELRLSLGFRPEDENWWRKLRRALAEAGLTEQGKKRMTDLGGFRTDTACHANAAGVILDWVFDQSIDAEAAYHKAIEIDPKYTHAWNGLGIVLDNQNRSPKAEAAFRKAIEIDPQDVVAWNNLGIALNKQNRPPEAEAAFRKSIEIDPQNVTAWNGLGLTLDKQNRDQEAEAAYRKAIEIDPQDVDAWNNLGLALDKQNRDHEAEAAYRKAIEIDPQYVHAWNNLGIVLGKQNRDQEAEAAFRKAIEIDPQIVTAWNGLGNALNNQNRNPEAEAVYSKAIEIDPQYVHAWNNLGVALDKQNRDQEAEATFRKAIDIDPQYVAAWNNLGIVLDKQNRGSEAEAAFRKAIEIDPQYVGAWNGLSIALDKQNRDQEAEAAYRNAIEIDPQYAFAWINLGGTYLLKLKQRQAGVTALLHGLSLEPDNDYGRYVLGRFWQDALPTAAEKIAAGEAGSEKLLGAMTEALLAQAAGSGRNEVRDALTALDEASQALFEPLLLALQALDDRSVLYRIAPEKREVVLDVMKRIAPENANKNPNR